MSITGIQGHLLEVTVVGCQKLRDTEWISRQDPYVCLQYGSTNFRTRTHTDGGRNPTFQEKFTFPLIEGLRELNINVWNSNSITYDDFIGSGKVHLQKVLSEGYDDSSWSLQTKTGRHAGEVRLILHYANVNKLSTNHSASAQAYLMPSSHQQQVPSYSAPFPASTANLPTAPTYTSAPPHASYPPNSASYPPAPYPQPHPYPHPQPSAYPPPYPSPSAYPPPPYHPPPQPSQYYPPGPYPGYPPPPY
ncbi:elicitor-responsive protein 1 [Diospyros lotus]|uniref:elicitor-responsive protein 1 n=1 Tax=Diospyros lotus TaxID=55363 RepID=UPI00224E1D97|nr:elicitor-responsive protein 1 [Diospyros lotus]